MTSELIAARPPSLSCIAVIPPVAVNERLVPPSAAPFAGRGAFQ